MIGRVTTAIVVAVVAVAGCSGSGEDARGETSTAASTPTATATTDDRVASARRSRLNVEWVRSRVEADQGAFCDDLAASRASLNDMRGSILPRNDLDAGLTLGCSGYAAETPDPVVTPEPTVTESESPEDRVIDSFRHNLRLMRDGGFCDLYPASGKANTVAGLEMIYPEVFEILDGDEVYAMLEEVCAAD